MFSFAFSIFAYFFFSPIFWAGVVWNVLVPIPFLNSAILNLWSKFGSTIVVKFKSLTGMAATGVSSTEAEVVKAVESAVEGAVVTAVTTTPVATHTASSTVMVTAVAPILSTNL